MTLGHPRVHLRQTGSTNDVARELAIAGAPHGALVTASEQTAGRGRRGRSWTAPAGRALLASVVLRDMPQLLTLRAAVAVARVCGDDAQIKWPNDVLVGDRKVAGILCETQGGEDWAIAGIGINVAVDPADFPAEIADTAGTLGLEPAAIEPLLERLLAQFAITLRMDPADITTSWNERDALRGAKVSWDGGSGTAGGIDEHGRLLVDSGVAQWALDSGEISLVRSG
ncbi:MAG TPA: biotin--[acetyl-CoA-carboxylase] ligase [Baekduia sp.]|nr:biotin--[acetyl-CoA-carboxylase] ligase [Baekduia sp.]